MNGFFFDIAKIFVTATTNLLVGLCLTRYNHKKKNRPVRRHKPRGDSKSTFR